MTIPHFIGVDIAKNRVDVFDPQTSRSQRVTLCNYDDFADSLDDVCVVFEASGGYERPFAEALHRAKIAYVRVNPGRARAFARASGRLAKTDRVDAKMLAEMGAALALIPTPHPGAARRRLADLVARRAALTAMIGAENNRLKQAPQADIAADIEAVLTLLHQRLAAINTTVQQQIESDNALKQQDKRLRTMPGIGPAISPVILAELPELGQLTRRQIASLAGLAPLAHDSGLKRGRRFIQGGRAPLRRALYLAAFIASRHDPRLKTFRNRLQNKGKPTKVAITATARKLLTILNAMLKQDQDYVISAA